MISVILGKASAQLRLWSVLVHFPCAIHAGGTTWTKDTGDSKPVTAMVGFHPASLEDVASLLVGICGLSSLIWVGHLEQNACISAFRWAITKSLGVCDWRIMLPSDMGIDYYSCGNPMNQPVKMGWDSRIDMFFFGPLRCSGLVSVLLTSTLQTLLMCVGSALANVLYMVASLVVTIFMLPRRAM